MPMIAASSSPAFNLPESEPLVGGYAQPTSLPQQAWDTSTPIQTIVLEGEQADAHAGRAVGVVTGCDGTALPSPDGEKRAFRFAVQLTLQTTIRSRVRTASTTSLYFVESRGKCQSIRNPTGRMTTVNIAPSAAYSTLLGSRTWPGVTVQQETFDTCAIVERLAQVVGKFCLWGTAAVSDLSTGTTLNARMLVPKVTTAIRDGEVFMTSELWGSDTTMAAAIAYAATGAGSTIVFENMQVDDKGRITVPKMSDHALAAACYRALRYLGHQAELAGTGSAYAYALTRGLHQTATVVAHTDEGGYVREVLRRGRFCTPTAVMIRLDETSWTGLPVLRSASAAAFQNTIFSLLLSTAAAVAVADPTVTIGDERYPQVLTVDQNTPLTLLVGRDESVPDSEVQVEAAQHVAEMCGDFATLYIYALTKLLGFSRVAYEPRDHLMAAFSWYEPTDVPQADGTVQKFVSRHLLRTGHYWYWIEPTGVLGYKYGELPAAGIMSGPRALPGGVEEYPALTGLLRTSSQLGATGIWATFLSARRNPAIDWLRENPQDGLAYLRVANANPDGLACLGVDCNEGRSALVKLLATAPSIASLCWVRGDARINAPAECMAVQHKLALVVVHDILAAGAGRARLTPMPEHSELEAWSITYKPTAAQAMGVVPRQTKPAIVRQMRAKAISAFRAAANAMNRCAVDPFDWMGDMSNMLVVTRALQAATHITPEHVDAEVVLRPDGQEGVEAVVERVELKPGVTTLASGAVISSISDAFTADEAREGQGVASVAGDFEVPRQPHADKVRDVQAKPAAAGTGETLPMAGLPDTPAELTPLHPELCRPELALDWVHEVVHRNDTDVHLLVGRGREGHWGTLRGQYLLQVPTVRTGEAALLDMNGPWAVGTVSEVGDDGTVKVPRPARPGQNAAEAGHYVSKAAYGVIRVPPGQLQAVVAGLSDQQLLDMGAVIRPNQQLPRRDV